MSPAPDERPPEPADAPLLAGTATDERAFFERRARYLAASTASAAHRRAQRMFVQYDAWCDPRLRRWLDVPENFEHLSEPAYRLFVMPRNRLPELGQDTLLLAFTLFVSRPFDRARTLGHGGSYPTKVKPRHDRFKQVGANAAECRRVIRELAEYQRAIFELSYPTRGERPDRGLELAIAWFASGRLQIDDPGSEWMNAEPDSWFFFCFAEFCLQAAVREAKVVDPWWLRLGAVFASMQEFFRVRYHDRGKSLLRESYHDDCYDGSRAIPDGVLRRRIEAVAAACPTPDALAEFVAWNAYFAFFDEAAPPAPWTRPASPATATVPTLSKEVVQPGAIRLNQRPDASKPT